MAKPSKGNINLNIGVNRKLKLEKLAEAQEQSMTTIVQNWLDKIKLPKEGE